MNLAPNFDQYRLQLQIADEKEAIQPQEKLAQQQPEPGRRVVGQEPEKQFGDSKPANPGQHQAQPEPPRRIVGQEPEKKNAHSAPSEPANPVKPVNPTPKPDQSEFSAWEIEGLDSHNAYRRKHGAAPLTLSRKVSPWKTFVRKIFLYKKSPILSCLLNATH